MPLWILVVIIALLLLIAYSAGNTFMKARASRKLMEDQEPYRRETTDYTTSMLVLGDSTAVGIGAKIPEESLAGLVAPYIGATYVENHAVSGAAVEELPLQIKEIHRDFYHLILIQIGANNILGFNSSKKVALHLTEILKTLPKADKVLVLCAGNVGGATMFPRIVRFFHTRLTLAYHKRFAEAVAAAGATYINLYESPTNDPFLVDPDRFLAADGLHPSSQGYALWFEKVKPFL